MDYRFRTFERQALTHDLAFGESAPEPGDCMPHFDLPTTTGGRALRTDFLGRRPLLLTFGSVTCPMTASASPVLERLFDAFGDRVAFLTVYVREAHPGERFPQPETMTQKMAHARALRSRDALPWRVAVDDLEGTFHRSLGGNGTSVWIMGTDGRVLFRGLWANDEGPLRRALERVAAHRTEVVGEDRRRLVPMLRGLGEMHDVLTAAGARSRRDFLRAAPEIAALGELASLFRPLRPLGRGVAAASLTAIGLGALVGVGVAALAQGRRRGGAEG